MKTSITKLINTLFVGSVILLGQACQKDYDMIDPPLMTDEDDLDSEDYMLSGLTDYFVTQFGEGNLSGDSWENAMDAAALRKLLTNSVDLSKSTLHISQGKYVMAEEGGMGVVVRKNIKAIRGGYSQFSEGTDVSMRNISTYPTIFSGDVNGNKKADVGDCSLLYLRKGTVLIEGITFQYGYVSQSSVTVDNFNSGIFVNGSIGNTELELRDCTIRDCISDVTTVAKHGGAALFLESGLAKLHNVRMLDNISTGRGGAIRLNTNTAVVMLDRCLLSGNSQTSNWGNGLQASNGFICINNSTFIGNSGTGAALNGGGAFLLTNTTLVGNSTDSYGAFRCETAVGGDTKFVNCVFVSENSSAPSFILNGSNREANTRGYNLYQRLSGFTMGVFDTQLSGNLSGIVSSDGAYTWSVAEVGSIKSYASRQSVIDIAKSFNPATSPIASLGETFAAWVGDDGFGVDMRGSARNPQKMQPGAYDALLQ